MIMKVVLCLTAVFLVCGAYSADGVCNRNGWIPSTISKKFFDDHICLLLNDNQRPSDLISFCRDFRYGVSVNTVMILTSQELNRLHNDLLNHQQDFKQYKEKYSKPTFYTNDRYDFIQCTSGRGEWYNGYYEQYGVNNNYQIYHGCHPVYVRPSFFNSFNC